MQSLKRIRSAALASLATLLALPAVSATPDISGTWLPVESLSTAWPEPLPLTAEARARYTAFDPDRDEPASFCMPLGTPRNTLSGTSPLEVLQAADRLYFVFQPNLLNAETRRVYLDKPLPAADPDRLPTWLGMSSGKWEGDTLSVETIEMEPQAILNGAGVSHAGGLRVKERWHLARDPQRGRLLVNDMVLEDPATFTTPLRLKRVFAWSPDARLQEGQCSDRLWIDQIWRHRLREHAAARKAGAK